MRTTLTCLALSLALPACGDDTSGSATATTTTTADTATGSSGDTSSTDGPLPPPTTSGDDNSASDSDPPATAADATSAATTDIPETTATDPSQGTTTATDDTTDDTTTGVMLGCGFEGIQLDATLVHDGKPPPPCGSFEFVGQNIEQSPGPVYKLDGCPCDSDCFAPDPWTFTLDVPAEALPAQMPICPRIVVERQMSKAGCELLGVTILETQNQDWPFPWYVAGSLLGPPAAAASDLAVASTAVEVCECDGCCTPPERYDLEFSFEGDSLVLPEDSKGVLGDVNDIHYAITNYQSHLSGLCDDSPAIDWVFSRQPAP